MDDNLIFKKAADQIYYFEATSWKKKDLITDETGQTVLSSYGEDKYMVIFTEQTACYQNLN